MSSAYATTAVRVALPIRIPLSVWFRSHSKGFRLKTNSSILKGKPCLIPPCMGIGPIVCPLMCKEEYAWSYMFLIKPMNLVLKPYPDSKLNRYVCEILSKASVKSSERIHRGVLFSQRTLSRLEPLLPHQKYHLLAFCHFDLDVVAPPVLAVDDLRLFGPESYNLC